MAENNSQKLMWYEFTIALSMYLVRASCWLSKFAYALMFVVIDKTIQPNKEVDVIIWSTRNRQDGLIATSHLHRNVWKIPMLCAQLIDWESFVYIDKEHVQENYKSITNEALKSANYINA